MSSTKFSFYASAPALAPDVTKAASADEATAATAALTAPEAPAAATGAAAIKTAATWDAAPPAAGDAASSERAGRAQREGDDVDVSAPETCAEERCAAEEEDVLEQHSIFKGDPKDIQIHSCASELTYESAPGPAAAALGAATVSGRLGAMMQERIQAMETIRQLLSKERAEEDGLRAEVTRDIRGLEEDLRCKEEDLAETRAKNEDYARQLGKLSATINELVESNHANIERMAELELDVAVRTNEVNEVKKDRHDAQVSLDRKADENAALVQQLEAFKEENQALKSAGEELQLKNGEFADELENLMTSLEEVMEQNTALEGEVANLTEANKAIAPTQQKNEELLDVVEGLTVSLNAASAQHKTEADKLKAENEALRAKLAAAEEHAKQEKERLEAAIEETAARATEQLAGQKDVFDQQVACLTTALNDAKTSCQKNRKRNETLRTEIEEVVKKSAASAENASTTIGQLEKDLEEEFEVTTQLKKGLDALKKMAQTDDSDKYADEAEDLLALLRMIQCWQLSHFQRINKLVSENKEHIRNVQTLC